MVLRKIIWGSNRHTISNPNLSAGGVMRKHIDPEERRARVKQAAAEFLAGSGLEKVTLSDGSTILRAIDSKRALTPTFKPSSETQPPAIPMNFIKDLPRDGMGVPPPPNGEDKGF